MGIRAPGAPGIAQAPKPKIPEFDVQRKKVEQRINADTQNQQDAMSRRFAAQGMLNSGAAIKQQGLVANQATQNREDALQQVDAAEIGEQQRRQEIVDQRDFAGNESAMARALQSSQFDKNLAQQETQYGGQIGLQRAQFDAERGDQAHNLAIAAAELNDDKLAKYNAYTKRFGGKTVGTAPQTTNPYDRRSSRGVIPMEAYTHGPRSGERGY